MKTNSSIPKAGHLIRQLIAMNFALLACCLALVAAVAVLALRPPTERVRVGEVEVRGTTPSVVAPGRTATPMAGASARPVVQPYGSNAPVVTAAPAGVVTPRGVPISNSSANFSNPQSNPAPRNSGAGTSPVVLASVAPRVLSPVLRTAGAAGVSPATNVAATAAVDAPGFDVETNVGGEAETVTLPEGTTSVPAALEETSPELELTESEQRQKNRLARDFLEDVKNPGGNATSDDSGSPGTEIAKQDRTSSYPSAEMISNDRFRALFGDEALNAQGRKSNEENAKLTE